MIKSHRIINFQSHEDTLFNFHWGVNCIIGESGCGKTATLRSLNLLVKNRPLKFNFHSDFAKSGVTSVKTILESNEEVKITKTKGSAVYTLSSNGKKEKWPKLNKQVPDRVGDVLNISDLNLQWQFDNPFLISASPGEMARVINEKTKIDEADEWIKTLNKNINALKRKQQDEEIEIEDTLKQLKGLRGLDKLNNHLNKIEDMGKQIAKLDDEYIQIDSILANIRDAENKIKEQGWYLKAEGRIMQVKEIEEEEVRLEREGELIKEVIQLKVDLSLANKYKKKHIDTYIKELKKAGICPTCFGPVGDMELERITNAIHTVI